LKIDSFISNGGVNSYAQCIVASVKRVSDT